MVTEERPEQEEEDQSIIPASSQELAPRGDQRAPGPQGFI